MKRLERNLESTTPFVNSDFNDILQEQHRIAYSAYLDGINDMKFSTFSTNRGIILSGIEIDAQLTTPLSGQYSWTIKIDKPTAVVYFDGQYYTPADELLILSEEQQLELTYNGSNTLLFYPMTQSINDREKDLYQVRQYQHELKGPGAGTYGSQSVTIDYRFNIVSYPLAGDFSETLPPNFAAYPGSTQGLPYVYCSWGGTSRNLSRLLKLNSTATDDILITHDLKKWTTTVSSIVDGFVFRDFAWNITYVQGSPKYETFFLTGRNELKGFAGLTAISGRFPIGYDPTSPTSPQEAGAFEFNYGTPSNVGGVQAATLSNANLPAHNHGGSTKPTTQNMDHSHLFYAGIPGDTFVGLDNPKGLGFGEYTPDPLVQPTEQVLLTRSRPYFTQWNFTSQQDLSQNTRNHKHLIFSIGQNVPHENRPSYLVALYYYKI